MKVKHGRETVTTKIAYIAGFFDGEGCVRIKHNAGSKQFYVIAHLTNSYKPVLEEVQKLFGGALRAQERTPNKTVYNWSLSSSEAVEFLQVVIPFLKEKKAQAQMAVHFHEKKADLSLERKQEWANYLSRMKREIIGNVYEHSYLLK